MKRVLAALVIVLAAVSLPACGESDGPAPPPPSFTADAAEGASVSLRPVSATADKLVVDVVAREIQPLYGAAFRLTYDARVLRFASMERAEGWPANAVELAKEGAPGTLVATVSAKGTFAGILEAEIPIARLTFDRTTRAETRVAFVAERSTAAIAGADKGTSSVRARWVGGTLR